MARRPQEDEVISTVERALELLSRDGSGRHSMWGVLDLNQTPPVLVRHHYYEGSSGGDSSDQVELRITPEVVRELKISGYVQGTPHWGYTDDKELKISEHGTREHHRRWRAKRDAEEAAKKP